MRRYRIVKDRPGVFTIQRRGLLRWRDTFVFYSSAQNAKREIDNLLEIERGTMPMVVYDSAHPERRYREIFYEGGGVRIID